MTCVVAVATSRRKILMGADSLIGGETGASWKAVSPKIWRAGAGKFGIGFCGNLEWGEVLRYHVRWPTKSDELPRRIKESIQRGLDRANFKITTGEDYALVCHKGVIYIVDPHLTVLAESRRYAAIGEDELANGALYATKKWSAQRRVETALRAAAEHSTGVRGPWVFLQL